MSRRHTILSAFLIAVILSASCASYFVWRHQQREAVVVSGLPPVPDLSRWPAGFVRDVRDAMDEARTASDPAGPLGRLACLYLANAYTDQAKHPLAALRKLEPANAKWAYLLAEAHIRAKESAAAEQELQETLALAPGYLPAWLRLAVLREQRGATDAARECYARAAAAAPTDPRAAYLLIDFQVRTKSGEDPLAKLQELARDHSEIKEPHGLLAKLDEQAGKPADAVRERRLQDAAPFELTTEDEWIDDLAQFCYNPDLLRILAAKAAREHRFDTADRVLKRAIQIAPADPLLRAEIYPTYLKMGRLDDALQVLEQGVVECPDDANIRVQLARMLCSERRAGEAVELTRTAVKRWPQNAGLRSALGIALTAAGKYADAVPELRESIRLDPSIAETFYDLAATLLASGDRARAREAAAKAVEMRPDYEHALALLGQLSLEDNDLNAADLPIRHLFELRPDDARARLLFAALELRSGAESERKGSLDAAKDCYRSGLKALPGYPPLLKAEGALAARQGHPAEAADALEQFVRAEPREPDGYLLLGQALRDAGQAAQAKEVLQQGLNVARETGATNRVEDFRRALGQ